MRLKLLTSFVLLCMLSSGASAHPDLAALSADFKSCVSEKMGSEKEKDSPAARVLLSACRQELDALLSEIPPDNREDVLRDLKNQISEQLKSANTK